MFWRRDTEEMKFLKSYDFKNKIVFDVGANVGKFSRFFVKRGAVKVYAFEPLRENRVKLKRLSARIALVPFALSDENGFATIRVGYEHTGTATLDEMIGKQNTNYAEEVSVWPLDEVMEAYLLPPPYFIKIDVEGWELKVLQGGKETIARWKPDLFIELHGATVMDKTENGRTVLKFLEDLGYSVFHIEEKTLPWYEGHYFCSNYGART